ncbi:MAG: hypothetical protein EBY22_04905 [Gammaproteobacteria bacterium]|nr:hypothetical protein [Gammaproteobacteria bacterium]
MADNSVDVRLAQIHSIPPASIVQNSNFPNVALHKLRASLFSCTTQANQTCENLTNPVREFIRPYQQTGKLLQIIVILTTFHIENLSINKYELLKYV